MQLGQSGFKNKIRTPDFIRKVSFESPASPIFKPISLSMHDAGNLELKHLNTPRAQIDAVKNQMKKIWETEKIPFCIGGDHLIKHAALEACESFFPDCLLIYIDAHPDIVQSEECTYETVIHKAFLRGKFQPANTFLIGLRQINVKEHQGLLHWNPKIIYGKDFFTQSFSQIYAQIQTRQTKYVYISIDLDGLDPSASCHRIDSFHRQRLSDRRHGHV